MIYIKVIWHHQFPSEPTVLYSELDDQRFELRKVELFSDGRAGFASSTRSSSAPLCRLGVEPVPSNDEINKDEQFDVFLIDEREFERAWELAQSTLTE